jgi:hypothetical protein
METLALDYAPRALDASWPTRRWAEPVHGRPGEAPLGLRLGHASDSAMVLVCTFPRARFDASTLGSDPAREIAYETTYTLVNLALHQIRVPGARPDGLVGSLVQFARQQADRYRDWSGTQWGDQAVHMTGLAGWQSGFTLACPDVYVIVHACGVTLGEVALSAADDLTGYEVSSGPLQAGSMTWELWRSQDTRGYEDLASVLIARQAPLSS